MALRNIMVHVYIEILWNIQQSFHRSWPLCIDRRPTTTKYFEKPAIPIINKNWSSILFWWIVNFPEYCLFLRCFSLNFHPIHNKSIMAHERPNRWQAITRTDDDSVYWCAGIRASPVGGLLKTPQTAKFMGPTWGPPGSCRPPMGAMLAPWTLLSGLRPSPF